MHFSFRCNSNDYLYQKAKSDIFLNLDIPELKQGRVRVRLKKKVLITYRRLSQINTGSSTEVERWDKATKGPYFFAFRVTQLHFRSVDIDNRMRDTRHKFYSPSSRVAALSERIAFTGGGGSRE